MLRAELARADRVDPPAVLLIDIDRFKSVNDTYGHQAGDTVLIAVAERLGGAIREGDTVARYGGEEFAVLLPEMPDPTTLEERAETIRRSVSLTPVVLPGGTELAVTASCGAAVWRTARRDEALLDAADRGLYAAKRGGRDRTRLASSLTVEELAARGARGVPARPRRSRSRSTIREASPEHHCQRGRRAGRADRRRARAARRPSWCAAGSAAGSTTSASSRSPIAILDEARPSRPRRGAVMRKHVEHRRRHRQPRLGAGRRAAAVRHHHERYDGSGYPDGLAGDEIPIEARIVAAADACSAITAGRAYSQPALEPRRRSSSCGRAPARSLDPAVVAALAAVVTATPRRHIRPARSSAPAEHRSEAA